jgi:2-keto-4-pentenoate hydratase/2-oxohepta-3-ene-1,7-dioic acid hydratase in catechol pathway
MRFIRYQKESGKPQAGWVLDDMVGPVHGDIFKEYQRSEATTPISSVQMLPPLQPGKIICVGRNYAAHAQEHGAEVPQMPLLFFKPPSSVIGPEAYIVLPPQSKQVEHEAELAVVIGQRGHWITPESAPEHIFGFTIANDITARDLQRHDDQWTRAKGFDSFCPIGPWIETEFDPADAMITCHVNGEMRQMASTRDMIFTIRQLIAFASSIMTLEPGDLLLTGTPAGVSPILPGDVVETKIDGIGSLVNPVTTRSPR